MKKKKSLKLISLLQQKIKNGRKWLTEFSDFEYAHQEGMVGHVKDTIDLGEALLLKLTGKDMEESMKKIEKTAKKEKEKEKVIETAPAPVQTEKKKRGRPLNPQKV